MSKELLFRSFEVKNLALRSNFEINASKQIVNQNDALDVNYLKQEILWSTEVIQGQKSQPKVKISNKLISVFGSPSDFHQKSLSSTPKTPQFNTENLWVLHQKPISSTHSSVPHQKLLSSTPKPLSSTPKTPQFHTKIFRSLVFNCVEMKNFWCWTEECVELRGLCVELRYFACWKGVVPVLNWGCVKNWGSLCWESHMFSRILFDWPFVAFNQRILSAWESQVQV